MTNLLLQKAADLLRPVPDFPKPGILFWDIQPLLREPEVVDHLCQLIADYWRDQNIDVVAGFDARGFIFGPIVAQKLGAAFEQIRKRGKLPGKTLSLKYDLEYANSEIEIIDDGFMHGKRVLLIDDVLATGGTADGGADLIELVGGTVAGLATIIELPRLSGRLKLGHYPVQSLISVIENQPRIDVGYAVDMLVTDRNSTNILLIERLNEPTGLAMPGGHLEKHESVFAAAKRELQEETGCIVHGIQGLTTLCDPDRDPRHMMVSSIVRITADIGDPVGEAGKTIPHVHSLSGPHPEQAAFVLGHGPVVMPLWNS